MTERPKIRTQTQVEALRPQGKPYDVRFVEPQGFLVRVHPGGSKAFYFDYRLKGWPAAKRARLHLGEFSRSGLSVEGARMLAKKAAGKVAGGIDVAAERKAERIAGERALHSTLGKFLERYEAWETSHRKVRHAKRICSVFPPSWLGQPLAELNTWLVESWRREARKAGKQATTINRDLAALKAVLSKAIEWGLIERSGIENLKQLKTDPIGRVRFLTAEEERRLRKALRARDQEMRERRERYNEHLKERHEETFPPYPSPYADHLEPMVLILLNTGLRFGELTQLRHRNINLKDRLVTVAGETAKSGRTRVVPMNLEAHRILNACKGDRDAYVFPGNDGNRLTTIKKAWKALLKDAAIADFRIHDLRHTFASRVKRGGADLYTVQRLLGHSTPLMTQRYAHLQPDDLRAAVECFGD